MFDPFGDFASEGYLRNFDKEKNLAIVKIAEHELFRAQLPVALDFLAKKKWIEYAEDAARPLGCRIQGQAQFAQARSRVATATVSSRPSRWASINWAGSDS